MLTIGIRPYIHILKNLLQIHSVVFRCILWRGLLLSYIVFHCIVLRGHDVSSIVLHDIMFKGPPYPSYIVFHCIMLIGLSLILYSTVSC